MPDATLNEQAHALRMQIEEDRRLNEAQWNRAEGSFARLARDEERVAAWSESRGLALMVAAVAVQLFTLLLAIVPALSHGPGELDSVAVFIGGGLALAVGSGLLLSVARIFRDLRQGRRDFLQMLTGSTVLAPPPDEDAESAAATRVS